MDIKEYFSKTIEKKASDLHLAAGSIPTLRVSGDLVKLENSPLAEKDLKKGIEELFGQKIIEEFKSRKDVDFGYDFENVRFRINLHYQEGSVGLSARTIPTAIPDPSELAFNETIYRLTHLKDGLLIVTGPSGSGKSTTLAAMINIVNRERRSHIITIEDPIEFMFKEEQSIIEQRELGVDTDSFASALKFALRQDPNVIMVGEMRDSDTISSALTAAETGHLVMSTLHTTSAPETVQRIVNAFPSHIHAEIVGILASCLRGVISQQLLPKAGGGQIVAREILINNQAIANLIRNNQISQIYSVIETGQKEGMITMNKAIDNLLRGGLITEETARNRKRDLATLSSYY